MSFYARRFNLYLLLLVLAGGCTLVKKYQHKDDDQSEVRIYVESSAQLPDQTKTVSVTRANPALGISPVLVTVDPQAVLTEGNLILAKLIETPGGFEIKLQFDESGSWMLEECSAANPGKHLVIFGQWGKTLADGRWLAAPLITHRIPGGLLEFTPDASREEAQRLVDRLNLTAKKLQTGSSK